MTCLLCGFETIEFAALTDTRVLCKNGCQTCTAVAKIDGEINEAATTLRRLLDKRRDLRTEQNRAHDPMHRLPVEIRNHTFELVLPRWDEWGDSIQAYGELPTHLSSVCRSWREMAWSNPFLWSTIPAALGTRSTSGWINFVHHRILRSGTLPLTFHLKLRAFDRGEEQSIKDLAAVMGTVSHCSNRLQSLSLDVPFDTLHTLQHSNFSWHRLTRLRILSPYRHTGDDHEPLPFFAPTMSPERIELHWVPIQSLQVSWNRLTSATVKCDVDDLALLFRLASQMTDCYVRSLGYGPERSSVPPIIHHRLKKFRLRDPDDLELATMLLDSFTLPCLEEFHTDNILDLTHLPALVHRSSCPLTNLTLSDDVYFQNRFLSHLEPLPGVTDLVVETPERDDHVQIKKLLLEGCFPDLHRLTLRLDPFFLLWEVGDIPLLLERRQLQPDGLNEGKLPKILVVDRDRGPEFDRMWKSDVGKELKGLGIRLREDGFEFL